MEGPDMKGLKRTDLIGRDKKRLKRRTAKAK